MLLTKKKTIVYGLPLRMPMERAKLLSSAICKTALMTQVSEGAIVVETRGRENYVNYKIINLGTKEANQK